MAHQTAPREQERCHAEEWHRDGRGLWARRCCRYYVAHDTPHDFAQWHYNVKPPESDSTALRVESDTLRAEVERLQEEIQGLRGSAIRELVKDLDFAIDVAEPRDVILRRFEDILKRSLLWR